MCVGDLFIFSLDMLLYPGGILSIQKKLHLDNSEVNTFQILSLHKKKLVFSGDFLRRPRLF